MKRFADSLVRQKGINPPPGYKTSISICRKFLNEHAPKKAEGETAGKHEPRPVSPAQLLYAKKIAQGKGLIIPDVAKANSVAMSAWIDLNRGTKRGRRVARPATSPQGQPRLSRRRRRRGLGNTKPSPVQPHRSSQPNSVSGTPLRIPYGNKESPEGLAPAMARLDGMPRRELICLHSASADGCSVWRLPTTTACL